MAASIQVGDGKMNGVCDASEESIHVLCLKWAKDSCKDENKSGIPWIPVLLYIMFSIIQTIYVQRWRPRS